MADCSFGVEPPNSKNEDFKLGSSSVKSLTDIKKVFHQHVLPFNEKLRTATIRMFRYVFIYSLLNFLQALLSNNYGIKDLAFDHLVCGVTVTILIFYWVFIS